ncbi:MAG: signal recognition particle-docking protein FtsY [Alphaproteobacteria bacterium]
MNFLKKLKTALAPSSGKLLDSIKLGFKTSNQNWQAINQHLTDALIMADITPSLAATIGNKLPKNITTSDQAIESLISIISDMLMPFEKNLHDLITPLKKPRCLLMVGVNGTGKTTTLAKLAELAKTQQQKPLLVAGDSFRAAGSAQLESWATKLNIPCWSGAEQNTNDTAAIAHGGYHHALEQGYDIVLIDTAGRLHTNNNLMAELEKIVRVLKKIDPALPHDNLITLDATTGQNASTQVDMFQKSTPLDGMVITKMDGLAKGGMVVSILARHQLPLYALGVGEKPADLDQFYAKQFAKSLFGR